MYHSLKHLLIKMAASYLTSKWCYRITMGMFGHSNTCRYSSCTPPRSCIPRLWTFSFIWAPSTHLTFPFRWTSIASSFLVPGGVSDDLAADALDLVEGLVVGGVDVGGEVVLGALAPSELLTADDLWEESDLCTRGHRKSSIDDSVAKGSIKTIFDE